MADCEIIERAEQFMRLREECVRTKHTFQLYLHKFAEDFQEAIVHKQMRARLMQAFPLPTDLNDKEQTSSPAAKIGEVSSVSDGCKQIFRNLALRYHPDKPGGDADLFMRAERAYKEQNILELVLCGRFSLTRSQLENVTLVIDSAMTTQQHAIDSMKASLAWAWCTAAESHQRLLYHKIVDTIVSG